MFKIWTFNGNNPTAGCSKVPSSSQDSHWFYFPRSQQRIVTGAMFWSGWERSDMGSAGNTYQRLSKLTFDLFWYLKERFLHWPTITSRFNHCRVFKGKNPTSYSQKINITLIYFTYLLIEINILEKCVVFLHNPPRGCWNMCKLLPLFWCLFTCSSAMCHDA